MKKFLFVFLISSLNLLGSDESLIIANQTDSPANFLFWYPFSGKGTINTAQEVILAPGKHLDLRKDRIPVAITIKKQ